jgi:Myb-like DNA-binding domain
MQGLFTSVAEVPAAEATTSTASKKRGKSSVRDGIDWEAISKRVATRDPKQCMSKWYTQLRPNMTDTSEWDRGDDMRLLRALWGARPDFVRRPQRACRARCHTSGCLGVRLLCHFCKARLVRANQLTQRCRRIAHLSAHACIATCMKHACDCDLPADLVHGGTAVQAFNVKWAQLVPGRGSEVAQRRWHLMRTMIPANRDLEMHQQARPNHCSGKKCLAVGATLLICLSSTVHMPQRWRRSNARKGAPAATGRAQLNMPAGAVPGRVQGA